MNHTELPDPQEASGRDKWKARLGQVIRFVTSGRQKRDITPEEQADNLEKAESHDEVGSILQHYESWKEGGEEADAEKKQVKKLLARIAGGCFDKNPNTSFNRLCHELGSRLRTQVDIYNYYAPLVQQIEEITELQCNYFGLSVSAPDYGLMVGRLAEVKSRLMRQGLIDQDEK